MGTFFERVFKKITTFSGKFYENCDSRFLKDFREGF
jgi:hypothetical protein